MSVAALNRRDLVRGEERLSNVAIRSDGDDNEDRAIIGYFRARRFSAPARGEVFASSKLMEQRWKLDD